MKYNGVRWEGTNQMAGKAVPDPYYQPLQKLFPDVSLDRVQVYIGSRTGWLFGMLGNYAVTFGHSIHLTPRMPQDRPPREMFGLYAHELTHVRQYRAYGFVPFLVLYGLGILIGYLTLKGTHQSPLETAPRQVEVMAREMWPDIAQTDTSDIAQPDKPS